MRCSNYMQVWLHVKPNLSQLIQLWHCLIFKHSLHFNQIKNLKKIVYFIQAAGYCTSQLINLCTSFHPLEKKCILSNFTATVKVTEIKLTASPPHPQQIIKLRENHMNFPKHLSSFGTNFHSPCQEHSVVSTQPSQTCDIINPVIRNYCCCDCK